jgi:hypothetical protein
LPWTRHWGPITDEKAAAIRRDRNLSAEGQLDAIRKAIAKDAGGHIKQMRVKNDAAIASLAARRAHFEPKVDRTIIGEQRRSELRRYLRELNHADRTRILFSGDKEVIEAIADAPAFLSGLTSDMRDRAIAAHVEKTHGPAMGSLAAEQAALENFGTCLAVAEDTLRRIAGGELEVV